VWDIAAAAQPTTTAFNPPPLPSVYLPRGEIHTLSIGHDSPVPRAGPSPRHTSNLRRKTTVRNSALLAHYFPWPWMLEDRVTDAAKAQRVAD
jgi:hypothetical protein